MSEFEKGFQDLAVSNKNDQRNTHPAGKSKDTAQSDSTQPSSTSNSSQSLNVVEKKNNTQSSAVQPERFELGSLKCHECKKKRTGLLKNIFDEPDE
jgi:hypothetical protein